MVDRTLIDPNLNKGSDFRNLPPFMKITQSFILKLRFGVGEITGPLFFKETSHLTCTAKQITVFCIKCNTRLKWLNWKI